MVFSFLKNSNKENIARHAIHTQRCQLNSSRNLINSWSYLLYRTLCGIACMLLYGEPKNGTKFVYASNFVKY